MENKQVHSDEMRRGLRVLLTEVEFGAHVTITRWNTPAAVMVPIDWYEQAQRALANGKEKP
jgi:prevent-host-death family protein